MKRRLIVYTGYFHFPDGDVAATRVLGIGKALRDAGYSVLFAGAEEHGRPDDVQADGSYAYEGFPYVSLGEWRKRSRDPWSRLIGYLSSGSRAAAWLEDYQLSDVAAVIVYNGLTAFGLRIQPILRQAGIPLVMDLTEWHDARHYPGGRFGLHRWDVSAAMRVVNVRAGNVIAISSYLERFYAQRGARVVRVPPLLDLTDPRWQPRTDIARAGDQIRIAYGGSPGQKDCIAEMLEGAVNARRAGINLELHFTGVSREQLLDSTPAAFALINELGAHISVHGRFPTRDQALDVLREMDGLMVIKRPGRSAEAQFPTKLAEYLALGRPVVANRTSDIAEYVHDGVNGVIIPSDSAEAVTAGIKRLAALRERWPQMRAAAQATAAAGFEYRQYTDRLGRFMNSVIEQRDQLLVRA